MKTLLIIQNDNNHFATICENLQQNDLEKFYTDYKNVFAQGSTKDFENFFKSFVFQIGATQSFMTQEDEIDRFFWELQKRNELDLILKYDESNGFLSFFIPANVDNNNLMIEYDMDDDYHILQTLNTKENNNEQHIDAGASRVGDIERERYSQEKTSGIERIGIDGERSREERLSGDEIQTLGEPSQRSIKNSETQTHNSNEERLGLSSLENSAIYMRGKAKTSNDRESSLFSTQEYDTKISQGDLAGKSQEASAGDNRPIYDMGRKNEQKVGVDAFTGKSKNFQSTNETYAQRVDLLLQSPKLASAVRKLLQGFTIQSEYSFIRQKFESNESGASANRADIGEQLQQESSLFDISGNDRWNQTILPNGRQIGRNRERSIERLGRGNETQLRGVDTAVIETLSTSKTNSGATTSISGDNASNLFGIQGMSSDDSNAIAEQEFAIKDDYEKEPNGDTNHQYAEVLPRETILGEWVSNSTNPRDNQLGISSSQVAQQNEERGILGESNINRESSIGFGTDHRENEKNDVGTSTNRGSFLDDMGGADNDLETSENKAQSNIDKEIEAEIAFVPNDKIKFNPEEWEIITLVATSENKLKSVSTPMFEEKTSQDFSHTESTQAQSIETTKEILDEEIVEPNEEYKIKDSLEIQNKNNLVLEKIKTNQKLLFDDENNPYYFITNFEMTFYDKDTDQYDFKKRDVNKPRSEYLEILKRDYPEIASKELKYYSSVKIPTPSGLRMLLTERSSFDGKYIEITSIEMPMEQYEKIDKIFDSPQVSNDNKEENHNMENIPSPVDDIEIRKRILKLKESIANEQTFKDTLGDKQNLHRLFESIFKEKYLDLYLENKSFFTKLGDKQVEFKNNIKDRIFNEIMEEYEKSLTTKENISTNFEKEEPVRQNSTNDDLNFKTFSDYQFLQILDGEEYRGEIDFNLNKAQRIQANLEALRLTQEILSQNRLVATSQEQEILAKFSGFGGLSELFNNEKYEAQRAEFENILGQKLYREILYSSFNAYYTPKKIINAMYDGFASMGVPNNEKIRALEPSCGIGHFITLAPPNYEFEAVEKDTLTATIAKLLHPKTRIHNKGFEEISFDREFDVVIGNPPYENIRVNDDSGNNELIHNYFVLKSQKLLKEQGISSFVITSGFLDSKTDEHRIKLAQDNFLVNAFRLPNIAFNVTHTSVLSDIVFLQKVTDKQAFKNRLLKANNNDEYLTGLILKDLDNKTNLMKHTRLMDNDNGSIRFNNFFDYYYKRILGDRDIGTNQFGEYVMQVKDTGLFDDTMQRIEDFNVANISGLFNPIPAKESKLKSLLNLNLDNEKMEYLENLSIGNIFEHNGEFYTKEDNFTYSPVYFTDSIEKEKKYLINKDDIIVEFNQDGSEKKEKKNINYKNYPNETEKKILRLLIEFRDLLKDNIKNERNLPNDEQSNQLIMGQKEKLRAIRARILSLADSKGFAQKGQKNKKDKKSGLVSQHRLQDIIELEKLESYRIISCENVVEKYNNNKKDINYIIADILNKRIVYPLIKTEAKNAVEALQKTISDDGFVNLSTLQSYLPNAPLNEICKELCEKELIFPNFETKQSYVLKADFLKGNIKQKYENVLELSKQENLNLNLPFMLPLNRYVDILKENFPKDIYFEDIEIGFGANFIDIDIYENFIKDTFYNNPHLADVKIERVNSTYVIDNFKIKEVDYSRLAEQKDFNEMGLNLRVFSEKGIKDGYNKAFFDLRNMLEQTINNKSLEVSHQEPIGDGNYKKVVETIPTKQAMDNAESIKDMFANYIFDKKEYRDRIEKQYNKIINVFSNTKLEYQKILEMPTLNKNIVLRPHQDNAVFKGICNQSMLFDHQVGAGKTFLSVALVMEQKRMGLINKALVLVPNHLCGQWSKAFMDAYPTSKLLVGDKINNKKDRKEFLYRARNGDFDAIIMKHSTFENISVMETFEKSLLEDELNKLKKLLKQNESHKDNVIKAKMRSLETKLTKKAKGKKFDNEIAFEDLGIDCLIVDEAHEFKNLYIDTAQYRVKGIPQTDSNKAMKMYCATQYIHQNNYKLYFLTGTPVSNSIAEFYTMQRYIQPQVLKDLGLEYFDDWQKAFTRIVTSEELDSSGVNYTIVNRLSKFVNTPELMMFYKQNTDIITREDIEKISGKIVPNVKGGKAINVVVPRSDVVANFIGIEDEYGKYNKGSIIDRMNNWHEDPKRNNILVCTGEARKAALDFRLINPQAEDYAESKLNVLAQKVMEHYNDTRYKNNTQLIFCDLGVSKINSQKVNVNEIAKLEFESVDDVAERLGLEFFTETEIKKDEQGNEFEMEIDSYWVEYKKDKNDDNKFAKDENGNRIISKKYSYTDLMNEQSNFDIYSEILKKLVKLGIPQNQIAFAGDAKNDTQKATLFNKMNEGEIRILIGSTSKMGTGTNVQRKIVAMHELDCPWRPADLEQRAGRVIRQGNMFFEEDKENFEVAHYRYATEQTYDARMFQINEQKLLPLIQIKKSEILEEQRVFDSVDAEATNLAEMKAIATGNPFILEKHKIDTLLKQEERYFDYHKKNIIGSERALEKLQDDNAKLQNQIQSLQECFNNQGFNQENYEIEVFGIKTTKRPKGKADEESFKKIREQVAKKLLELENYPENFIQDGKVEVLKANGISLVFRVIFESTESGNGNPIFIGSIVAPNGKSFVTGNLNFKTHRGGLLHQRNIVLDGLLERIKNAFDKIPATLQKTQERIKDNEIAIQSKKNFLSKNKDIESYERKILLNTLKQDMRNIQEIMKIRNEQRKEGIKIDMNSQEVAHLLPQYMKLLDEKGKFVGADKAQQIELLKTDYAEQKQKVESIEQKLSEHAPSERKMPESIDMNIASVEQAQIEFQEFLAKHSTEEKIAILQNNQVHIVQAPRSRNIVGV